jgi:hypothetical protein
MVLHKASVGNTLGRHTSLVRERYACRRVISLQDTRALHSQ